MQALAFLIFYQRCWKSSKIRPSSHFPLAGRLQVSPPTSTQEKGHTPWQAPHPWLLLLLLLFPGSQAQSKAHVLHKEAGQTLTVRCQYPSTSSLYEMKGWCKEASAFKCIRLVTSSKPRTLASISRFSIWDDPDAGFFTVITTDLREEDSGHYWCRIYRPSDNSVSKSVRFYLVVSPGTSGVSHWLTTAPSPPRQPLPSHGPPGLPATWSLHRSRPRAVCLPLKEPEKPLSLRLPSLSLHTHPLPFLSLRLPGHRTPHSALALQPPAPCSLCSVDSSEPRAWCCRPCSSGGECGGLKEPAYAASREISAAPSSAQSPGP
nr:natural cytotoxicity triggering receptor 2 isoform X3 [Aotus nancymaae]